MQDFLLAFSAGFACTLGVFAAVVLIIAVAALVGAFLGSARRLVRQPLARGARRYRELLFAPEDSAASAPGGGDPPSTFTAG